MMPNAAATGEMAAAAASAALAAAVPGIASRDGVTDDAVTGAAVTGAAVTDAAVADDVPLVAGDVPCAEALEFVAPESWLVEVPVVVTSPDPVAVVGDVLPAVEDDAAEALLEVVDSVVNI
jgi:hypothetical protein